ncbi:MAG: hypothetical protein N2749_04995 [Clostridia bacterium]|nr:hypothetical protein [Clostridia bacterium]
MKGEKLMYSPVDYGKDSLIYMTVKRHIEIEGFTIEQVKELKSFTTKKEWEDYIFSLPNELSKNILLDSENNKGFPEIYYAKEAIRLVELGGMTIRAFCIKENLSREIYKKVEKKYMPVLREYIREKYVPYSSTGKKARIVPFHLLEISL